MLCLIFRVKAHRQFALCIIFLLRVFPNAFGGNQWALFNMTAMLNNVVVVHTRGVIENSSTECQQ